MEKITLSELKKEMLKSKKNDKAKSAVLVLLIDYAQKIAKEKNEEPNEEHIKQAVKKYLKVIEDQEKSGIVDDYEKEIILGIKSKIFPPEFSETELEHIITEYLNDNPGIKQGQVMKWLKASYGERVNMKTASKIVQSKK